VAIEIQVFDRDLQKAIRQTINDVGDLTIPFGLIAQSWFKTNRAISSLKSPGKYKDLSEAYKPTKKKKWGYLYPILGASGKMLSSITLPGPDSINMVINKTTLVLGSKVSYGKYHQYGTNRMPARPWILLGPEQVAPPEINRRKDAWIKVLQDFVVQRTNQRFGQ
jgi:phage gpG-like protein